jgi:hypothetical protein
MARLPLAPCGHEVGGSALPHRAFFDFAPQPFEKARFVEIKGNKKEGKRKRVGSE